MTDAALAELLTLTVTVNDSGTTIYSNHLGQLHRVHGPAIIRANGDEMWYQNDRLHREDGPADGSHRWFLNGERFTEREFNEQLRSIQ